MLFYAPVPSLTAYDIIYVGNISCGPMERIILSISASSGDSVRYSVVAVHNPE